MPRAPLCVGFLSSAETRVWEAGMEGNVGWGRRPWNDKLSESLSVCSSCRESGRGLWHCLMQQARGQPWDGIGSLSGGGTSFQGTGSEEWVQKKVPWPWRQESSRVQGGLCCVSLNQSEGRQSEITLQAPWVLYRSDLIPSSQPSQEGSTITSLSLWMMNLGHREVKRLVRSHPAIIKWGWTLLALGACGLNHCISLKLVLEPPGGLGPTP